MWGKAAQSRGGGNKSLLSSIPSLQFQLSFLLGRFPEGRSLSPLPHLTSSPRRPEARKRREIPSCGRWASIDSTSASRLIGARLRRVEASLPASGYVFGVLCLLDTALASGECKRVFRLRFGSLGCRTAAGPAHPCRSREWMRQHRGTVHVQLRVCGSLC